MLNQPTREAFEQDFLQRNDGARPTPSIIQISNVRCPIRLNRFARVLGEPLRTFRYSHISQFAAAVRPYFGDFAACPDCLREGFHSVLFSFTALQDCPVHCTRLWNRAGNSTIAGPKFFNELHAPLVRCGWGPHRLDYAVVRSPKANTDRDRALGEIADWIMAIGVRYWVGTPKLAAKEVCLDDFTQRLVNLKKVLKQLRPVPSWVAGNGGFSFDPARIEIVRFGTLTVRERSSRVIDEPCTSGQNTDLMLYYRTLYRDFKAIHRHLKRQIQGTGRRWLAKLANATDTTQIGALLHTGGAHAQAAWALLQWWRQVCSRDFNPNARLVSRPFGLALDQDIPHWIRGSKPGPSCPTEVDAAHLWTVRWISAAGLLAFWHSIRALAKIENACATAVSNAALPQVRPKLDWALGISSANVLTLCIDHSKELF